MKFNASYLFALGLALAIFSCDQKERTVAPSPAPASAATHLGATYVPVGYLNQTGNDGPGLVKFNKTLYPTIDSLVFAGQVKAQAKGEHQVAELVNITDNQVIANAVIDATDLSYTLVRSANFIGALPAREITVGVRIRTSQGYEYWPNSQFYLYLYRSETPTLTLAK